MSCVKIVQITIDMNFIKCSIYRLSKWIDIIVTLLKHLENDNNNGFRMRQILALNTHWYDALSDYSPTRLKICPEWFHQPDGFDSQLLLTLQQKNLADVMHLTIHGYLDLKEVRFN